MDAIKIKSIPFVISIASVFSIEYLTGKFFSPSLITTGIARLLEIMTVLIVFNLIEKNVLSLGLSRKQLFPGLKKGIIWSFCFGILTVMIGLFIISFGTNPIKLIHASMPASMGQLAIFYIVGGLIAPVAEEIFFRGLVYGYIRGLIYDKNKLFGILIALFASTFLFVFAHQGGGFPFPQLVGGFVFCISYEIEKKLVTPIVIHSLGNLALFTISLI